MKDDYSRAVESAEKIITNMPTYESLRGWLKFQMELEEIHHSCITVTPGTLSMNIYLPCYCGVHDIQKVMQMCYDYIPACVLVEIKITNNFALFE